MKLFLSCLCTLINVIILKKNTASTLLAVTKSHWSGKEAEMLVALRIEMDL